MKGLPVLSSFQTHVAAWEDCERCGSCKTRQRVVLVRGTLPCDVLFVGEAPGESEDTVGKPFVGPAGKLLDRIVAEGLGPLRTRAFTNLVGCIPREDGTRKAAEPDGDEILACSPRLREVVEMAKPRLIVCVGKLAETWLDTRHLHNVWKLPPPDGTKLHKSTLLHPGSDIPRVAITHPAAILRANIVQRGLMVQRCVVTLQNAAERP